MDPIDIDAIPSFGKTHEPPRAPTSVTAMAPSQPQPFRIYLPPSDSANTRVVYDSANGFNRLAGNSESLVIAITVKGKPSRFSVFFGPDSPFNCKGDVPKSIWGQEPAQLYTTIITLLTLRWGKVERDTELVVVKTDKHYDAVSMSKHVWNWERNGFANKRGGGAEHAGMLEDLHSIMLDLEKKGVEVRFWIVGEDTYARSLAEEIQERRRREKELSLC